MCVKNEWMKVNVYRDGVEWMRWRVEDEGKEWIWWRCKVKV